MTVKHTACHGGVPINRCRRNEPFGGLSVSSIHQFSHQNYELAGHAASVHLADIALPALHTIEVLHTTSLPGTFELKTLGEQLTTPVNFYLDNSGDRLYFEVEIDTEWRIVA